MPARGRRLSPVCTLDSKTALDSAGRNFPEWNEFQIRKDRRLVPTATNPATLPISRQDPFRRRKRFPNKRNNDSVITANRFPREP